MESERMKVEFKELTIACDGTHTHILADGKELGVGCLKVYFEHDCIAGESRISLTKVLDLVPEKESASGN